MSEKKHDPTNLVFTEKPEPTRFGHAYGIWTMFTGNFGGHEPQAVYYDFERMLWVIEIDGTEHTVY